MQKQKYLNHNIPAQLWWTCLRLGWCSSVWDWSTIWVGAAGWCWRAEKQGVCLDDQHSLCGALPPTAQPRQRGLYAQQADVEQLLTWFKIGATEVLLSSLLDWTAVWRTAKTVRQELRNQTGVRREVDLNASKLNFKLTHRCYNLLTAGLESTLLVAGEDPLLSGQTWPWFQLSTHKVYSSTLFTLTRDLQQFTHWFVPQMRPNMRREGRAAAACCRFSVQTRQRHRD